MCSSVVACDCQLAKSIEFMKSLPERASRVASHTIRSGWAYANGRTNTALTTL